MTNMKTYTLAAFASAMLGAMAISGRAQIVDLTPSGSPIFGVDYSGDYSQFGTAYDHAGGTSNLVDGTTGSPNLGSHDDTFVDNGNDKFTTVAGTQHLDDSSYVGFTFANPPTQAVTALTVNFFLFGDGGWFGQNNTGGSSPLLPSLLEPTLQVTLNGSTWTTVSHVSDYLAVVGVDNPGSGATGTVTFTLAAPASGIEGIRVTGIDGGYAGAQHGFVGVSDERVFGTDAIPEPSTYALMSLGLLVMIGTMRIRRTA